MNHFVATLLTAVALIVAPITGTSVASAQPGQTLPGTPLGPEVHSENTTIVESYRGQIVAADSVAGGLLLAATVSALPCLDDAFDGDDEDSGACGFMVISGLAGIATYALAGPAIHLSKGNGKGALMSAALRIGLPAAAIALSESTDDGDLGALMLLGGAGAAMAIDWAVLSKIEKQTGARFVPTVYPSQGAGVNLGVAGSF